MGIVTIFYCLRFETSLFVTFYDSQAYGGGILPCLHTGCLADSLLTLLLLLLLLYICLVYQIGESELNSSAIFCHENDTSVVQEMSVYIAVRMVLVKPLAGSGRLALTPIFWLSSRVFTEHCSNPNCSRWSSQIHVSTSHYLCNGFTSQYF
jgi:hypothetical protein